MAHTIRHGSPQYVDTLVSYALGSDDIIISKHKLEEFMRAAGVPVPDLLIDELKAKID